jgi:Double zinc ribbon
MSRFRDELRIISPIAWAAAFLVGVAIFSCLFFIAIPHDHEMRNWPVAGAAAFALWPSLLVSAVVVLAGYINADARRRGMRHVMWTLLALFLPNTIGIILYFILRTPIQVRCPKCGAPAQSTFTFCPQCGTELSQACPGCKRPVEPGWQRCPYCGTGLKPASPPAEIGTAKG